MSKQGPDFSSILNTPMDDVEAPKPFPVGHYVCIVKGLPRSDKSSKKQTPFLEFNLQPVSAMDDVDEDELRAFGGLVDKMLRRTFYLTPDALFMLKDFFEACLIETSGRTTAQCVNDTPNCQVVAQVKHRLSDSGRTFTDVVGFSKVGGDDDEGEDED